MGSAVTVQMPMRYVKALCRQLGVRYLAFHENVEQYAKEQGLTLEEAGRNIRRQIFEKVCKEKTVQRLRWRITKMIMRRRFCGT